MANKKISIWLHCKTAKGWRYCRPVYGKNNKIKPGERLAWAHKSRSFCSSSSDTLPEKTITWGVCSSLKTPTRQFTSQLPRLGFQQRP